MSVEEERQVIELGNSEQEVPETAEAPKLTRFQEDIKEILVELSEKNVNDIKESFKKGMILLQYVDEKVGKVKQTYKEYLPITFKKQRAITKALKKSRMLKEELKLLDKDGKPQALDLDDLKSRFKEILPADTEEDDIHDETLFNELNTKYVIASKAKIYFGIDDIDNYAFNDLAIVIGLYELRNNFTPY